MGVNSNCGNLEEYVSTALLLLYQQFDNYEEKLLFAFAKSMERMHKLSLDTLHHLETGRYRLLFNALATNLVELSDEEYDKLKDQASSFLSDYKAMARPIHFKREAFSLFNEIYNIINKYIQ